MLKNKKNISNKFVAYNGAMAAVAAVFFYSVIIMIYVIIRSSTTIYHIMPAGERSIILWTNSISVAYSVAIFSMLMAIVSILPGCIAALMLKQLLLYFNPYFNKGKSLMISLLTSIALSIVMYLLLYALLKQKISPGYPETFLFWFLFPAAIFIAVNLWVGNKLTGLLKLEWQKVKHVNKLYSSK